MYQIINMGIVKIRMPDIEDEKLYKQKWNEIDEKPENSLVAGAVTGAVYRVMGGPKKMAIGAGLGVVAALTHCLYAQKIYTAKYTNSLKEWWRNRSAPKEEPVETHYDYTKPEEKK
jgi:hypothetical protein